MKTILIIVGLLFVAFCVVQVFGFISQRGIETYPYTTIKIYDSFQVREYESMLFTSVKLNTNGYKKTSSKGFSILAGYIFGGNDTNKKIAMTSPVSMSLDDSVTMMFMVPKHINKQDLPVPNESSIIIKQEPAKTMAAITFGGWANDEKIEDYKKRLVIALKNEGISYSDRFYFYGYNAPYEIFNRINEVLVELE